MFAAGPGTITAVVTLAAVHTPNGWPLTAIVAGGNRRDRNIRGFTSRHSVRGHISAKELKLIVTRFMGLIVAAMGMQFVPTGIKAFFYT